MKSYFLILSGFIFLVAVIDPAASKRFRDIFTHSSKLSSSRRPGQLAGWRSNQIAWNEQLYPYWEKNDVRWKSCWKGGKVVAHLGNDGPTLVRSNVTFSLVLKLPSCQKEDDSGDIVYDLNCKNVSSFFRGQYVYNWTSWIADYDWFNCTKFFKCDVFPDGQLFPKQLDRKRRNFVYIWHTQGQYYQSTGGTSMTLSINTTNIILGDHMMEVSVYRRDHHRSKYIPIATASDPYTVTDRLPIYVQISQKDKRTTTDNVYIKDLNVIFDVKINDPSNYLKNAAISYSWKFGDGPETLSKNPTVIHNYTKTGHFNPKLIVKAIIPVPCNSIPTTLSPFTEPTTRTEQTSTAESTTAMMPTTTPKLPTTTKTITTTTQPTTTKFTTMTELSTTPETTTIIKLTTEPSSTPELTTTTESSTTAEWSSATTLSPATSPTNGSSTTNGTNSPLQLVKREASSFGCNLYRYGSFETNVTVVDGIGANSIAGMTNIQISTDFQKNSVMDFVVTCKGSIPTDVCTMIADPTCMVPKSIICDPVVAADTCNLTFRRSFNASGIYCVNITLKDNASLAVVSTLVSIGDSSRIGTGMQGVLIFGTCVLVLIIGVASFLYKRYKEYTQIGQQVKSRCKQLVVNSSNASVHFSTQNTTLFFVNDEKSPLLKKTALV
ncbi:transmembrane glycoprotein NMB isoform X1 [Amblyraja radiata]|uniref:transmembrane glycoprotein NMB isoform X1 n=1 Tax=Amblyraja radiata TaxID=386614 RepID=UPI00140276B8|nr:transmembrane glycoprotein NMB isoform X1 [Amblyraja radiata]